MILSHPEAFAVRHAQYLVARATEVQESLAENTGELLEPDSPKRRRAMRAQRLNIVTLLDLDHRSVLSIRGYGVAFTRTR
jgi:hypothetical protein